MNDRTDNPAEGETNTDTYPLSPEQERIVIVPPDYPQLILAPPGTGKTHIVVARIQYLIEKTSLQPNELAVLCFSRAAVYEIMSRVRNLIAESKVHDDLRFVSVRTFDSFATRILLAGNPDIDLSDAGYNRRIEIAIEALSDPDSEVSRIASKYRHLIVDELQDIVGVRARFVQALLNRIQGGFTILGDPAQAIYGFTLGQEEEMDSEEFVKWIRQHEWNEEIIEKNLTHNFRSSEEISILTENARDLILNEKSDQNQAYKALKESIKSLNDAGDGINPDERIRDSEYDSVCILCRTNGEVMQIASMLAQKKVNYFIKPRVEEYGLPAWIGRILGTYTHNRISFPEFQSRWENLIGSEKQINPEQAFRWLKYVEGRQASDLDTKQLHNNLYRGQRLPDEANAFPIHSSIPLNLSTIHASKGREFDHVVVLSPDLVGTDTVDLDLREEAKILYVAATRAKKELSRLNRNGIPYRMWKHQCESGRKRWIAKPGNKNAVFMEIGMRGDVDPSSPVNKYVLSSSKKAKRSQELLWDHVNTGTRLYIHKQRKGRYTFFNISLHRDTGLDSGDFAVLSLQFKDDLRSVIQELSGNERFRYPGYWPTTRVAALATELLPPYPENVLEPFSKSGFCLGIRISGMVYVSLGRE